MIAAYTDVISLEDAKIYLRIDDGMNVDDVFITQCINASLGWIEQHTNHQIKSKVKYYYKDNECSNKFSIYDYPIVSIDEPTDYSQKVYSLRTVVTASEDTVTATLGYASASDVPEVLIQAAYQIIQSWYYNSDKPMQVTLVPDSVRFALLPYRRFIV